MTTYEEFPKAKTVAADEFGFDVDPSEVHPLLKPHQRDIRSTNDAGFDGDTATSWPDGTQHNVAASYQGAPLRVFLKSRKGGDMAEWPEDLRVREWPV